MACRPPAARAFNGASVIDGVLAGIEAWISPHANAYCYRRTSAQMAARTLGYLARYRNVLGPLQFGTTPMRHTNWQKANNDPFTASPPLGSLCIRPALGVHLRCDPWLRRSTGLQGGNQWRRLNSGSHLQMSGTTSLRNSICTQKRNSG